MKQANHIAHHIGDVEHTFFIGRLPHEHFIEYASLHYDHYAPANNPPPRDWSNVVLVVGVLVLLLVFRFVSRG